ncbi:MAG: 16S rRNA (uracil(1498)-N(3))-methyltransferase [Bacteroidota bacterium]|nr:16S rRNA (uracil(1498)-N(3))-methyltransferase [Bacteroidota bacterium]
MEYYYTPKEKVDLENKELIIDDFEFSHLTKVLRKRAGERLTITDGERNIYYCEITKIEKNNLICKILGHEFNIFEPEINVSIYLSPLRNSARFEFAIEKVVELGAARIQPVITEFTVNKHSYSRQKIDRLSKIIIGAMGQSQRCYLPKFHNAILLTELITNSIETKNKVVMYESSYDNSKFELDENSNNILLLIGPEGGFSKDEIDLLKKNGWQVKSLGERKLRAETAAIVSLFDLIKNYK